MPVILSLATAREIVYGAGPDGLFQVLPDGTLQAEPQPMESLYCCAAVESLGGPVLLVGGAPHGAAARDAAGAWQAGWMDYTDAPVLQIAPAPNASQTGIALAASGGAGILRTTNRGRTWSLVNFGLREFVVLALTWAPPPPPTRWPAREIVFAGSERGLYRSPAGGLGWMPVEGIADAVQAIAVAREFHENGEVLAGTESSGLWRSRDGGYTFAAVPDLPDRIDALLAVAGGWYAATPEGIWHAGAEQEWRIVPGLEPALCLCQADRALLAGGSSGIQVLASDLE